jgi:hypothetical protein
MEVGTLIKSCDFVVKEHCELCGKIDGIVRKTSYGNLHDDCYSEYTCLLSIIYWQESNPSYKHPEFGDVDGKTVKELYDFKMKNIEKFKHT